MNYEDEGLEYKFDQIYCDELTGYKDIKSEIEKSGVKYFDQSVVVDRNLISSREPKDLPEFCHSILNKVTYYQKLN